MSALALVFERVPRPLLWTVLGHAGLALVCLAALLVPAAPVMGVHPAIKPLKFAISITVFLASVGLIVPSLTVAPAIRSVLTWTFVLTMLAEILPIVGQSVRGTTSHFNVSGPLDAAVWQLMALAIVLATLAMLAVAVIASFRPLVGPAGEPLAPLMAFAWRAGLWLLLLTPVSGFAMAGRMQHSVGGVDGGIGLPFANWSTQHGDLRVAHFFALHALQVLPAVAWVLLRVLNASWARWCTLSGVVVTMSTLCIATLAQAFAGRPLIGTVLDAPAARESPAPPP